MKTNYQPFKVKEIGRLISEGFETILITFKTNKTWELYHKSEVYTPESFEKQFCFLPPCPPSASKYTRKLYYKHHKTKNNPSRSRRGRG